MKHLFNLTFASIFIIITACSNQSKKTDNIATVNTEEITKNTEASNQNDEIPRTSITVINSNVLVLNYENSIYVNISEVSPENTIIKIAGKIHTGEKGLFKITPKELGEIAIDVFGLVKGKEVIYGRQKLKVVTPETTMSEIFKMN